MAVVCTPASQMTKTIAPQRWDDQHGRRRHCRHRHIDAHIIDYRRRHRRWVP